MYNVLNVYLGQLLFEQVTIMFERSRDRNARPAKRRRAPDDIHMSHRKAVALKVAHAYDIDARARGVENAQFRRYFSRNDATQREHIREARGIIETWKSAGGVPGYAVWCLRNRVDSYGVESWLRGLGLNCRKIPKFDDTAPSGHNAGLQSGHAGESAGIFVSDLSDPDDHVAGASVDGFGQRPQQGSSAGQFVSDLSDAEDAEQPLMPSADANALAPRQVEDVVSDLSGAEDIDALNDIESPPVSDADESFDGYDSDASGTCSGEFVMERRSFVEVLCDVQFEYNIPVAAIDAFLKALHENQPEVDIPSLPHCGRTIQRLGTANTVIVRRFAVRPMTTKKDKIDNETATRQRLRTGASTTGGQQPSAVDASDPKRTGSYLHLGLERALMCDSPGLYHFPDHIAMLRRVEAHAPGFLSEKYLELAFGDDVATARVLLEKGDPLPPAYFWYDPGHRRPTGMLFTLNMHVDGVVVFENTDKGEVIPILGSIHEIVPFDVTTRRADFRKG